MATPQMLGPLNNTSFAVSCNNVRATESNRIELSGAQIST